MHLKWLHVYPEFKARHPFIVLNDQYIRQAGREVHNNVFKNFEFVFLQFSIQTIDLLGIHHEVSKSTLTMVFQITFIR